MLLRVLVGCKFYISVLARFKPFFHYNKIVSDENVSNAHKIGSTQRSNKISYEIFFNCVILLFKADSHTQPRLPDNYWTFLTKNLQK